MKNIPTDMADNAILKQKALPFLPRNLGEIDSQKQILKMISLAFPEVAPFISQSDKEVWSKVQAGALSISTAIAQCAFHVDTILEKAFYNKKNVMSLAEKDLLGAWIALDYYAYVLKTEYSFNILQCRQHLTEALLAEPAPQTVIDDCPATEPVVPGPVIDKPQTIDRTLPVVNTPRDSDPIGPKIIPDTVKVDPGKPDPDHADSWFRMHGKKLVLLAAAVAAVILVIVFLCGDVQKTKSAIGKIGDITLDSEEQILNAEELYEGLDEDQQEKVSNRDDLFAARAEYDSLVTESAIDAIGTVTLERQDAIVHAEQLYDALSRDAKNLVDNYKTLTAARKEYDRLDTAVKTAEKSIDAIGTVTLSSGPKIEEARKDYDALKKDNLEKYLADKSSTLINAEKQYRELVSQDHYDTGMEHFNSKRYEDAIPCFDTVITDYSDTALLESARKAKADSQIALAEQSYSKRDYQATLKALNAVEAEYQQQENYQKLQEKTISAITKARPKNGATIAGNAKWGYCYFNITAKNQDVCFKFVNISDSTKYKLVFVRAGETAKVNLENGIYSIKYTTGTYWFGKDQLFGDDGKYFSKGTADCSTSRSGNWIYYRAFTLDMNSSSFQSSPISADAF